VSGTNAALVSGRLINGSPMLPVEFIYRPTQDPMHPGYPAIAPAGAGDVSRDVIAVHQAAMAFRGVWADATAGTSVPAQHTFSPLVTLPIAWLEMEVCLSATANQGEFYKYRAVY